MSNKSYIGMLPGATINVKDLATNGWIPTFNAQKAAYLTEDGKVSFESIPHSTFIGIAEESRDDGTVIVSSGSTKFQFQGRGVRENPNFDRATGGKLRANPSPTSVELSNALNFACDKVFGTGEAKIPAIMQGHLPATWAEINAMDMLAVALRMQKDMTAFMRQSERESTMMTIKIPANLKLFAEIAFNSGRDTSIRMNMVPIKLQKIMTARPHPEFETSYWIECDGQRCRVMPVGSTAYNLGGFPIDQGLELRQATERIRQELSRASAQGASDARAAMAMIGGDYMQQCKLKPKNRGWLRRLIGL